MGDKAKGNLLIIGGAEDKENDCLILKKFFNLAGDKNSRIVIMTTATENPEVVGETYYNIFRGWGCLQVEVLNIADREQANNFVVSEKIAKSTGIFFTGGDQLRITSILGGTLIDKALHESYDQGTVIAGTSAGASAMSDTMIVEGRSDYAPKNNTVKMAPGMGLLQETVIDQHFAQRGRIGRLLTAVAQNPYILGIGIDEDTSIVITSDDIFEVIGSQTVTIIDGKNIEYTNVSEARPDQMLALSNVCLHILPHQYKFDLRARKVIHNSDQAPIDNRSKQLE